MPFLPRLSRIEAVGLDALIGLPSAFLGGRLFSLPRQVFPHRRAGLGPAPTYAQAICNLLCIPRFCRIETQRSGFDSDKEEQRNERALTFYKKSRSKRYVACSDVVVDLKGFEPSTSRMRTERSPN